MNFLLLATIAVVLVGVMYFLISDNARQHAIAAKYRLIRTLSSRPYHSFDTVLDEATGGMPDDAVAAYKKELAQIVYYMNWWLDKSDHWVTTCDKSTNPERRSWYLRYKKNGAYFEDAIRILEDAGKKFDALLQKAESEWDSVSLNGRLQRISDIDFAIRDFDRLLVQCHAYFDVSAQETLLRSLYGQAGQLRFRILGPIGGYKTHRELLALEKQVAALGPLLTQLRSSLLCIRNAPQMLLAEVDRMRTVLEQLEYVQPSRFLKRLDQIAGEIGAFVLSQLSSGESPMVLIERIENYRKQIRKIPLSAVSREKALLANQDSPDDSAFEKELERMLDEYALSA